MTLKQTWSQCRGQLIPVADMKLMLAALEMPSNGMDLSLHVFCEGNETVPLVAAESNSKVTAGPSSPGQGNVSSGLRMIDTPSPQPVIFKGAVVPSKTAKAALAKKRAAGKTKRTEEKANEETQRRAAKQAKIREIVPGFHCDQCRKTFAGQKHFNKHQCAQLRDPTHHRAGGGEPVFSPAVSVGSSSTLQGDSAAARDGRGQSNQRRRRGRRRGVRRPAASHQEGVQDAHPAVQAKLSSRPWNATRSTAWLVAVLHTFGNTSYLAIGSQVELKRAPGTLFGTIISHSGSWWSRHLLPR